MKDVPDPGAPATARVSPFGAAELLAAVRGAGCVLDAGCGTGRLTVELARRGAAVTGIDTSRERLEEACLRAAREGVDIELVAADFDLRLPFGDASFDAVTSRLALMAARDPVAALRELRRVLTEGAPLATAVWASPVENPWFAESRAALASALGQERASFARAFGRLGDPDEAAGAHVAAGLRRVRASTVRDTVVVRSAEAHWRRLARDNGHFRRADAVLDERERARVVEELARRLASYRRGDRLVLPRTQVLVVARR